MQNAELVRDVVLPLVEARSEGNNCIVEKFHGTCFTIGKNGYAVTNAHLLGVSEGNVLCALTITDTKWKAHAVLESEPHPTEDVAILRLESITKASFMKISPEEGHQGLQYMQFCYPEEVVNELYQDNKVILRPDLVYLEGYIRRRLSNFELLGIEGNDFYELSEPGTIGCSGSPIVKNLLLGTWM